MVLLMLTPKSNWFPQEFNGLAQDSFQMQLVSHGYLKGRRGEVRVGGEGWVGEGKDTTGMD